MSVIEMLAEKVKQLEERVAKLEAAKKKPRPSRALVVTEPIQLTPSIAINISKELMQSWADTYPPEYLQHEWKAARNYILANPHKTKQNWGQYFNNWFKRGWDRYSATLKSNPALVTEDELRSLLRGQDAEREKVSGGNE
ncbi:MAG: hypothetical protein KF767_18105 [Bdellovibrionaceae bacterium]|nr:hypothetical protein [Pseudobdellovibrionaceae bacterium]